MLYFISYDSGRMGDVVVGLYKWTKWKVEMLFELKGSIGTRTGINFPQVNLIW